MVILTNDRPLVNYTIEYKPSLLSMVINLLSRILQLRQQLAIAQYNVYSDAYFAHSLAIRQLPKYPVFCSWCGRQIGESEIENSHGICKSCKDEQLKNL